MTEEQIREIVRDEMRRQNILAEDTAEQRFKVLLDAVGALATRLTGEELHLLHRHIDGHVSEWHATLSHTQWVKPEEGTPPGLRRQAPGWPL